VAAAEVRNADAAKPSLANQVVEEGERISCARAYHEASSRRRDDDEGDGAGGDDVTSFS
jgi:hypothetical protein